MKPEELRIGNWVRLPKEYNNGNESLGQILSITNNQSISDIKYNCKAFNLIGGFTSCKIELLLPIPLTPEILEKCGFSKVRIDHATEHWFKSDIVLEVYDAKVKLRSERKMFGMTHVHQLQNLYFALTGEELTINL